MSEPLKKPGLAPESYDPHEVPEIVKLVASQGNLRPQETLVESFNVNGIPVDVVDWRETIWCGKLAYGRKNGAEPNVDKLLHSYLKLDNPALTREPSEPEWAVCMSLNYLSERPRGIMFGMQVDTEEQPKVYDIYKVPPARFMRVLLCEETAAALGVEMFHGGIPPYEWIGEHIAPQYGYRYGSDTLPVFEYYGYYDPETNKHKYCYLYVPVERVDAPESYDPRAVPEIISMAAELPKQQKKRGNSRMIEIQNVHLEQWPPLKFIGKRYTNADRVKGGFGVQWTQWHEKGWFAPLEALPVVPGMEPGPLGFMRCLGDSFDEHFEYWIGTLDLPDSPVPDGYEFIDLPAATVGICWLYGREKDGLYGQHTRCTEALQAQGWEFFDDPQQSFSFERYSCERFKDLDGKGRVILDYGIRVKEGASK